MNGSIWCRAMVLTVLLMFTLSFPGWLQEILSGWATKVRENDGTARIMFQIKNISQRAYTVTTSLILLRDTDGFTYQCQPCWISELQANFDYLLPGEVGWYELSYEMPVTSTPEVLIIPLGPFGDDGPSQRIPVLPFPGKPARQSLRFLLPTETGKLAGLRWSLDFVSLDEDIGLLSLVITMSNPTGDTKRLEEFMTPHLKDNFGRLAKMDNPEQWWRIPLEVKPGEWFKLRFRFDVRELQPPFYLFLWRGIPTSTKIAWRVLDGKP